MIEHRQNVLAAAYAARPDRFVRGPPRAAELPEEVWINRALPVTPVDPERCGTVSVASTGALPRPDGTVGGVPATRPASSKPPTVAVPTPFLALARKSMEEGNWDRHDQHSPAAHHLFRRLEAAS